MAKDFDNSLSWYSSLPRSTRTPTLAGIFIIAFAFMGFGVWGNTAPIAGAVVASGTFVATGQNKIVQHLEGGVIKDIAVHEGSIVKKGDLLLELDETAPRAELRRLFLRSMRLIAIVSRLQSEAREKDTIEFPRELTEAARDREIAEIINTQQSTFLARHNATKSDIASLTDGIKGLQEHINGTEVQLTGVRKQLSLVAEEIEAKVHLLSMGLVRKPEVLLLQRTEATLQGEVGRLMGDIGDAKERISRYQEQINGVRKTAIKTAVEQLHEIRGELADVRERIIAAKGILDRVKIIAPVDGVVVKLKYHTRGGVIEAGKPILEILPTDAELIIEARVRPQDIDNVKHGQLAVVRLVALSRRVTPMISGEVVYLSADAVPDDKKPLQMGPSDIYVVRVKLNAAEAAAIPEFSPTPGMPAEVYVKTSERTFFQYVLKPIQDSMSRAFRER